MNQLKLIVNIKTLGAAGPSTLPGGLGSSALGGTSPHIQRPQQPSLFKSFIQEFRNSNNQQQRPRSPQFQTYRPYFGQTNPLFNLNPSALQPKRIATNTIRITTSTTRTHRNCASN
uniref:Uncharacterized protein n=1 Tax=Meloidogyne enterolobii TaxID=390850 RepID=A0A6V7WSU3_MELEN|nr:unnamed protein product [Meloidogyne enterolobii]